LRPDEGEGEGTTPKGQAIYKACATRRLRTLKPRLSKNQREGQKDGSKLRLRTEKEPGSATSKKERDVEKNPPKTKAAI